MAPFSANRDPHPFTRDAARRQVLLIEDFFEKKKKNCTLVSDSPQYTVRPHRKAFIVSARQGAFGGKEWRIGWTDAGSDCKTPVMPPRAAGKPRLAAYVRFTPVLPQQVVKNVMSAG
jgi:hypothetical protein